MGSALALAASLALVPFLAFPGEGPKEALWPLALLLVYGAWAYAIAQGAYGSKGALVALLAFAVLWAMEPAFELATMRGVLVFPRALSIVGGLGAVAGILPELRTRRGGVQWGTVVFFLAPLLVALALRFAIGVA